MKRLLGSICILAAAVMMSAEPAGAMYECSKIDFRIHSDYINRGANGVIYPMYITNVPPGDGFCDGEYIYCDGNLEEYDEENPRHKTAVEEYHSFAEGYKSVWDGEKMSLLTPEGTVFPLDSKGHTLEMLDNGYIAEHGYGHSVRWRVISKDGEYVLPGVYSGVIGLDWNSFLVRNGTFSASLIRLDHWIGAMNTDIRTYINGYEIPCWAVDGYVVVTAEDLGGYGFDVNFGDLRYDEYYINIKRNKEYYEVNPVQCPEKQENGTLFSQLYPTLVSVYYDGIYEKNGEAKDNPDKQIKSYALDGYMLIRPEDLAGDGISCVYDNNSRRLDITVEGLARND